MTTILQILPRLVTGGVERGTVEMAAAIQAAGWNAIVASAGGPMVEEITRVGGRHIALPLASKNPLIMYRNIRKLKQLIEKERVNLVHARSRAPAWSAYFAAKNTGTPFVTTFHNAYSAESLPKQLYNSVMAKGKRVIAISPFVADYAQTVYGVSLQCLRTIPRGVDVERFDLAKIEAARIDKLRTEWRVPTDKKIVLLPGRLTRWKGHKVFIDAMARIKRDDTLCLFVGSGDADYRQELARAIEQRGLNGIIRMVGECRDMPAAFGLGDIVVSTSTRPEGFGRVIVEAQAMGCLLIATDHGGAAETIQNGVTGFLTPPGDAAKLAEVLKQALDMNETKRKIIGTNAIVHVRMNFTTALMTERTLTVYREILQQL